MHDAEGATQGEGGQAPVVLVGPSSKPSSLQSDEDKQVPFHILLGCTLAYHLRTVYMV